MFKFVLEEIVYYLVDNKVRSAPILSRMLVDNLHDDWASTNEQKLTWQYFGPSIISYRTIDGVFAEHQLFNSKESLAKFLIDN